MGVVHRAVDSRLRRTVALKFLEPGALIDGAARQRFLREARAAAALDHPSIGTIHEIGEWEGQPYIVMSYYEGLTLADRIRNGRLSIADVEATLTQIAAGLEEAHGAGVVHRDLKPANIMVTRSGQIKILDFGLAKLLSSQEQRSQELSSAGVVMGTVAYMSPEQARGEEVDHRTDLWAAGVIAYEMLTGVSPFQGQSTAATLGRIMMAEPRPLAEVRDDVPSRLVQLTSRLLSRQREDRPSSARAIVEGLATDAEPPPTAALLVPLRDDGQAHPSGARAVTTQTRALLLTDVVDSTKLSAELGDAAMAELWARHDRVARDLLAVHRGREIDKTDGFLLLFDQAADAVAYAMAYHGSLRELNLRARAGLHVGTVVLRENPLSDVARGAKPLEVDGLAKPTAARVMATACGGQTLLTPEARGALGSTALRTLSHGHWRMKGVPAPIELFEVGDQDAPFTPPPDGEKVYRVARDGEVWLPVRQIRHNLPRERDAFVGREPALRELARLLEGGASLVSVLGPGGSGKTRLVVRYGWSWLGDWPGGVWFCDLSESRDADGIAQAVGRTLDVPLGGDPVEQLGHAIAARGACLVILDNFEQVATLAATTLGRWLDRAPAARFLVTTRMLLRLRGEAALAIDPLPLPDALALFVSRASTGRSLDAPSSAERADIEALVKLLDGLPLAVELVAARARVMPPRTLLARMSERFKLLATPGVATTRQSALRATLDWSWNLLEEDERAALAQLSVFEGGFCIEAAESVLSLRELWPLDAVQGLVDKSIVRRVSETRYDLQMSVREYAAERLGAVEREEAERRHGRHHAAMGSREALESLRGPDGLAAMTKLAMELGNLVAATRRAVARADGDVAAGCLAAAWRVLQLRGPLSLALDLAGSVNEIPSLTYRARTLVRRCLGKNLQSFGRHAEARAHLDAAVSDARECGERHDEAEMLELRGLLHLNQGRLDLAQADVDAALTIARAIGNRPLEANLLGLVASIQQDRNELDGALASLQAALAAFRELGDAIGQAKLKVTLSSVLRRQGKLDEARAYLEAAIAGMRVAGDRRSEARSLWNLGSLHEVLGRMADAFTLMETSVTMTREVGDRQTEGKTLAELGNLYRKEGLLDKARASSEAALLVARECRNLRSEGVALLVLGDIAFRRGALAEAGARIEVAVARFRELGRGRDEAEALALLGRIRLREGAAQEGRSLLEQSAGLLRDAGGAAELAMHHAIRAEVALSEDNEVAASAELAEALRMAPAGNAEVAEEIARVRRLIHAGRDP